MSYVRLLRSVEELLRYEQEEGRTSIETSSRPELSVRTLAPTPSRRSAPVPSASAENVRESTPRPPVAMGDPAGKLAAVADRVAACRACSLYRTRTRVVPGQGCPSPEVMFVGEGPGAEEDRQGLAFVGRAGQLLTRMIEAMGLKREDVFIGNIVKCRPPENRTPMPDEMAACMPFLLEQIAILKPRVIVALGATAVRGLLNTTTGIVKLRGQWMLFEGIDVMPTFHPAYLLRNPPAKREAWDDLKSVLRKLGREIPPVRQGA